MRPLKDKRFSKCFYRNEAEKLFADIATKNGWLVTKRGWPDFICYKGQDVMFVEVKKKSSHRLKIAQKTLMDIFKKHGIKTYKWSPEHSWLNDEVE